ncbi:MAG: oligogalacturonate lyase, partial [Pseudomonadota bacterium]|nr:oligogalacturonate lyase [Pseudomonadota bacterium]
MKLLITIVAGATLLLAACSATTQSNSEAGIAKSWIDKDTGHRIVRVSEEPGSRSLYFHQNAYTAEGDKMVISVTNPNGVAVVDLRDWSVKRLYEHPDVGILFVGKQ